MINHRISSTIPSFPFLERYDDDYDDDEDDDNDNKISLNHYLVTSSNHLLIIIYCLNR